MNECEQCLREHTLGIHCSLDNRGRYVGCHETFLNIELYSEHLHRTTRGCKWPGDIEDFYRKEGIWHKKEKKPEEEGESGETSRAIRGTKSQRVAKSDRSATRTDIERRRGY